MSTVLKVPQVPCGAEWFGGIASWRWSVKGSWWCWVKLCHGCMVACFEREEKLSVELLRVLCCPRPQKSNGSPVLGGYL